MNDVIPGQPGSQEAFSVGIGLRWVIARRLAASVDLAHVLDGTTTTNRGMWRAHGSAVYWF